MICMYTHVVARVLCVYPLCCCIGDVCLHNDIPTMHAPWLSHCKSSWSCVNWKLASKHLGVTHGVIPHAAKISALTRWSRGPFLRDARCVNKLFNLISLTECGFYGHLEEDGLFYLNMDVYCRSRRYSPLSFSKLSRLQNETDKKQERSLIFAAMNMCLKRCLLSCMVGLTRLTTPRGWSAIRNTNPVGVKGWKVTGSLKGHGLKRLGVKGCFNSPSPGASGLAGSRVNDEVSRF